MDGAEPNNRDESAPKEQPDRTCETLYEWDGICAVRITKIECAWRGDRKQIIDEHCVGFITEPMS